ncbi:2OG-Fe(II) oxygenase [Cupriavidus pinatubonensis]|nr:2OG-Fe(II) oxygenase [Cupriavidus pinatubonensis]QYY29924.1 2OG-Fe(II) oxygenase [Cupriavidus pinatubonensis]TPQ28820.1 prolyl 4-hydroxylase [Cupriavidus pinatubonensis]
MPSSAMTFDRLDWQEIAAQLDQDGYAGLPGLLSPEQARELGRDAGQSGAFHHHSLESAGLGRGEMVCLGGVLPDPWADWRTALYCKLAPIANRWNALMNIDYRYPRELREFIKHNREAGQSQPLSCLHRLRSGDYLALHQRADGEHVFPLQVIALLSEPGVDFQGGEFVMTEQRPRMQSRPAVVPLGIGDMAIISTARRPHKGAGGHYRVNLRHAISRVRAGDRIGVELSFHNAPQGR